MRQHDRAAVSLLMVGVLLLAGCGRTLRATRFLNPEFDFSFVERVAVLPFDNLSDDRQAGSRSTRLMITEILASGSVEVVETGEVREALAQLPGERLGRVVIPSTAQIVSLGKQLKVQAVILGTVAQSETIRSGPVGIPVVTLDVHMVETESGVTVWAATHTETGGSVGARVLGTGGQSLSETTRRCVGRLVRGLVK